MSERALPLLEQIRIASPCPVRWEDMTGDDKARHCASCNLKVYNLSAMTRDEAEALVVSKSGERLCVQLHKRADGTVITQDCPVGLAAARARVRRAVARVAAAFGIFGGAAIAGMNTTTRSQEGPVRLRALNPFVAISEWLVPSPPPMPPAVSSRTIVLGGAICVPTPQQPAPPPGSTTVPFVAGEGDSR
jgi:hypothetical protein